MSARTPLSAGTRLAIWLSIGAALPVGLTVAYDLTVSGLLTLRSGYTFGWAVVVLGVLLVVGVVRLLATRHQKPPPRERWAVGAPLLTAALLWAVMLVLSGVRL